MREIKFRAWFVGCDHEFQRCSMQGNASLFEFFSSVSDAEKEFNVKAILMQFTGLRDKNGNEIYEGDTIKFTYWWFDGNEAESTLEGTIVYTPETMSYSIEGIKNSEWLRHIGGDENGDPDTSPFALFQFEEADFLVTGNIYENGKA
jgi:uncharacterized phage protein (TIGR01671 family)